MSPDEIDRLRHMRDAAYAAMAFATGKGRADLEYPAPRATAELVVRARDNESLLIDHGTTLGVIFCDGPGSGAEQRQGMAVMFGWLLSFIVIISYSLVLHADGTRRHYHVIISNEQEPHLVLSQGNPRYPPS